MSRYIDAEALLKDLKEELEIDSPMLNEVENKWINKGIRIAIKDVKRFPTADVVEVVRCKDCKYYTEHYQDTYGEYGRCDHPQQEYEIECFDMWVVTNPDDYCSYGERREQNER